MVKPTLETMKVLIASTDAKLGLTNREQHYEQTLPPDRHVEWICNGKVSGMIRWTWIKLAYPLDQHLGMG